ncbi:hypothetical protein TSMEX_006561 [Taenia solium]|eukprot:TsM_000188000 transcript=TsM_000188000 gene=TsM_000188000
MVCNFLTLKGFNVSRWSDGAGLSIEIFIANFTNSPRQFFPCLTVVNRGMCSILVSESMVAVFLVFDKLRLFLLSIMC